MTRPLPPAALPAALLAALLPGAALASGERITVTGEIVDTWCYFSGVMGGPEAVVGTAHHTCALWCSAGGIPVGLLARDGTVYMVLEIEGAGTADATPTQLHLAGHEVTADGIHYARDGLNYIVVEEVVADAGLTNLSHEDFGITPGFAIPEPEAE